MRRSPSPPIKPERSTSGGTSTSIPATYYSADTQPLTRPIELNTNKATRYQVPILQSIKPDGRPVELSELYFNPDWSKGRRIACTVLTVFGLLICFATFILVILAFIKALAFVQEKNRLRTIGLFMVPNVIDDEDGVLKYKPGYLEDPRKLEIIKSYVGQIQSVLNNYYRTRISLNMDYVNFSVGLNCSEQNGFGYYDGQPCVLLGIRNIGDWIPTAQPAYFYFSEFDSRISKRMKDKMDEKHLPVLCREDFYNYSLRWPDRDTEAEYYQRGFNYYPEAGFPMKDFSLKFSSENGETNRQDKIVSLVMLQSAKMEEMSDHRIECEFFAENLKQLNGTKKIAFQGPKD